MAKQNGNGEKVESIACLSLPAQNSNLCAPNFSAYYTSNKTFLCSSRFVWR